MSTVPAKEEDLPQDELFPPGAPPAPKFQSTKVRVSIIGSYWVVILLALPLWWVTTSIERLPLPRVRILEHAENLKETIKFPIELQLTAEKPGYPLGSFRTALNDICFSKDAFNTLNITLLEVSPGEATEPKQNAYTITLKGGRGSPKFNVTDRGISLSYDSLIGMPVIAAQTCDILAKLLAPTLTPVDQLRIAQYSPRYRIAFSLLNEDASAGGAASSWEIEQAIQRYLSPTLNQLGLLHNFTIESQVQFHAPLLFDPLPTSDIEHPAFLLAEDHLKVFVNSAEWTLSSSVSNDPVLHFVVFIPSASRRPLRIADSASKATNATAFIVPQWGGIVIHNPPIVQSDTQTSSVPSLFPMTVEALATPFSFFRSQLQSLVGISPLPERAKHQPNPRYPMTEWQLDALIRRRVLENRKSGVEALESIIKLVDRIEGMPVGKAVRSDVNQALDALDELQSGASATTPLQALMQSARALAFSSKAFFNPNMVAMLYFPAEHQYAVYTPLFAPVAVPLIVAALREVVRWYKDRKAGKQKTE